MNLPAIQGIIRRRMLINYRVDPDVAQRLLPHPFRPKLHEQHAIAGICLIRLEQIRPRHLPAIAGVSSENAAHRIAVCWTAAGGAEREGVYIPRRDTNSRMNTLLGGRLFPGQYQPADFDVTDAEGVIDVSMRSHDGETAVRLRATTSDDLPASSAFQSLTDASAFFEAGSAGYSACPDDVLEGMQLEAPAWHVRPLAVDDVFSSYFDDTRSFPPGSVTFDSALIMRDLPHRWRALPPLPSHQQSAISYQPDGPYR